ncbi:MAG: papain-like cysteine protease family protein [Pseudomonadota bacterium]
MSYHLRTDSDGNVHGVVQQNQANNCVIASLMMIRNQVRQMSYAENQWNTMHRKYREVVDTFAPPTPVGPMTWNPASHANNQRTTANMFSNVGTYIPQVTSMLRTEGLKARLARGNARLNPAALGLRTPAMVAVSWRSGGGHAIVAAGVNNKGQIVFLDPASGTIVEMANNGSFANSAYGGRGRIFAAWYVKP